MLNSPKVEICFLFLLLKERKLNFSSLSTDNIRYDYVNNPVQILSINTGDGLNNEAYKQTKYPPNNQTTLLVGCLCYCLNDNIICISTQVENSKNFPLESILQVNFRINLDMGCQRKKTFEMHLFI